jgi:hypothetical protein
VLLPSRRLRRVEPGQKIKSFALQLSQDGVLCYLTEAALA